MCEHKLLHDFNVSEIIELLSFGCSLAKSDQKVKHISRSLFKKFNYYFVPIGLRILTRYWQ